MALFSYETNHAMGISIVLWGLDSGRSKRPPERERLYWASTWGHWRMWVRTQILRRQRTAGGVGGQLSWRQLLVMASAQHLRGHLRGLALVLGGAGVGWVATVAGFVAIARARWHAALAACQAGAGRRQAAVAVGGANTSARRRAALIVDALLKAALERCSA